MKKPWLILFLALAASGALAKRAAPPVVEPVTMGGVRYSVAVERTNTHFNVILRADRVFDSTRLSTTPVYRIQYEPKLEKDVQEIFPESLKVEGNDVVLTDEKGTSYRVTLQER